MKLIKGFRMGTIKTTEKASFLSDISFSAVVAGFVAMMVGHAIAITIVFQGARAAGVDETMMSSWVLSLGVGMGVISLSLSWFYRIPIVIAWSTPGAALLATSLNGQALSDVVGAFIFVALLTIILGVTGWFSRLMDKIPLALASAMLAGILLEFGVTAFAGAEQQPILVGVMVVSFLLAKRFMPTYGVIVLLVIGAGMSALLGLFSFDKLEFAFAEPHWVTPTFDLGVILGIGFPLFVVTMTAQNMPGVLLLKASGYKAPVSPVITSTGIAALILSPFGGYTFNFAAITAALCMGEDAHPDKDKRYVAGIFSGFFNIVVAICGGTLIALLAAFPDVMIATLAGLALLGAIGTSLHGAMEDTEYRESALVTLLVTISGVQFLGVASAFWGIVAGMLAFMIINGGRSQSNEENAQKEHLQKEQANG